MSGPKAMYVPSAESQPISSKWAKRRAELTRPACTHLPRLGLADQRGDVRAELPFGAAADEQAVQVIPRRIEQFLPSWAT
jgi:hypothetical protein